MQTIAHNMVYGQRDAPALRRAAIITTLAPQAILPTLRDIIKSQVQSKIGIGHADVKARIRECLERISVSRVFDMEGLWEVLSELELESTEEPSPIVGDEVIVEAEKQEIETPAAPEEPESSPLSSLSSTPPYELPPLRPTQQVAKTEVMDSEDEGELSPISPSSPSETTLPEPAPETTMPAVSTPTPPPPHEQSFASEIDDRTPGVIVITHFSTLLSTLFTQRDKSSAHTTLQLFSSHLRYLARSSGPLIMLLNTTTNAPSNPVSSTTAAAAGPATPGSDGAPAKRSSSERPMDPTLRSIFNPLPPSHGGYGAGSVALSKKNKPSFGLTFSQFLDLHLQCTRVPRTRADAEAVFTPAAAAAGDSGSGRSRYAWVVEVLLDESGYWTPTGERIDREQRWGAVDVKDGVRTVDAFEKVQRQANTEMFRLAAGFGGRRV